MSNVDLQKLFNKPEALTELLQTQEFVRVHLDARLEGVVVPAHLKDKGDLILEVGFEMPVPVRDLRIEDDEWSATLTFGRQPFHCIIPWKAVYLITNASGFGSAWDGDVPPDVLEKYAAAEQEKSASETTKTRRKLPPGWGVHPGGKQG